MNIIQSKIFSEVKTFAPNVYQDERGFFLESFNTTIQDTLQVNFYQDNHSKSKQNVIRGIHYQWDKPMGKLVRVIKGSGFDFLLDLRVDSPTFGKYELIYISENNYKQVWVPEGFGHAFVSLEDDTHLIYKCSALYNSNSEGCINPLDKDLNIDWPLRIKDVILSEKDQNGQSFTEYKLNPKF